MNITVENTRITSNVERMVDKSAAEVASYVRRSATHHDETKGALANAQKRNLTEPDTNRGGENCTGVNSLSFAI